MALKGFFSFKPRIAILAEIFWAAQISVHNKFWIIEY